jgi:hypothetical protein
MVFEISTLHMILLMCRVRKHIEHVVAFPMHFLIKMCFCIVFAVQLDVARRSIIWYW